MYKQEFVYIFILVHMVYHKIRTSSFLLDVVILLYQRLNAVFIVMHGERKDFMYIKKMLFLSLILCLLLSGCTVNVNKRNLTFDHYFLCSSESYDPGILLFDKTGDTILNLSDACVSLCITPDGIILPECSGAMPDNTILFIQFEKSGDDPQGGVWSIEKKDWLVSPEKGMFSYISDEGILEKFYINGCTYGIDFKPISDTAQASNETPDSVEKSVFDFSDRTVLHNQPDSKGNYYIADENGECYLDGRTFYEKNSSALPAMTCSDSISIAKSVLGKYMILYYNQIIPSDDGITHMETASYLCTSDGNVLYPEWDYDGVLFATDQFGYTDRNYLMFFGRQDSSVHSIYLPDMKVISFSDEFQEVHYCANGLFLLNTRNEYAIYDSIYNQIGARFTADDLSSIYVLGPDSYIIQQIHNNRIVIENKPQICKDEIAVVTPGEYPVICSGKFGGLYRTSYVLDSRGRLLFKANDDIVCADNSHYMTVDQNTYLIKTYMIK